jgi:hypothetical protein
MLGRPQAQGPDHSTRRASARTIPPVWPHKKETKKMPNRTNLTMIALRPGIAFGLEHLDQRVLPESRSKVLTLIGLTQRFT